MNNSKIYGIDISSIKLTEDWDRKQSTKIIKSNRIQVAENKITKTKNKKSPIFKCVRNSN